MTSRAGIVCKKGMAAALTLAVFLLAACQTSPADNRPSYQIRNAPASLPRPKAKPTVPSRYKQPAAKKSYQPKASGHLAYVRKGDTLYSLSKRHKVQMRDVIRLNNLRPPFTLSIGQRLRLPGNRTYTVRKGDTGYSIAQRHGVTVYSLFATNGIRKPYTLSVGQVLKLPGAAKTASSKPTRSKWATKPTRKKPVPQPTTRKGKEKAPRVVTAGRIPAKSGRYFAWPMRGQIISRFGPKKGGIHNDGINILGRKGAPVRAAEAGVVVYASNALEGFGNLVLIKHQGGWVTAYAHNASLYVRPGQIVNKGERIATVGTSGGVVQPQLHFEIRRARKALDPLRYLSR